MADADGAYGLAFAARQLQDELQLVLCLGLEDGRGCASVRATEILKDGIGGGSVDGDGSETTIELVKSKVRHGRWWEDSIISRHGEGGCTPGTSRAQQAL
jgi:hypothetical protein